MTLKDIQSGLALGKIIFDRKGHLTNDFDHTLDHQISFVNDMIDKHRLMMEIPGVEVAHEKSLLSFYEWKNEVKLGQTIGDIHDIYCFHCGANCSPVLIDENTIAIIPNPLKFKLYETKLEKYKYLIQDSDIPICEATETVNRGYLEAQIDVPTGELVFANFFRPDKFYQNDKKRGHDSICATKGRELLMHDLAKENIGYGQMGNMSVVIFAKNDGTEIIVSKEYGWNDEDGEFEIKHDGFKMLGMISLSVWRWQCGDKKILLEGGEELPADLKVSTKKSSHYEDYICTKVKPGRWEIKHFYDFFTEEMDDSKTPIYSHLKLIQ